MLSRCLAFTNYGRANTSASRLTTASNSHGEDPRAEVYHRQFTAWARCSSRRAVTTIENRDSILMHTLPATLCNRCHSYTGSAHHTPAGPIERDAVDEGSRNREYRGVGDHSSQFSTESTSIDGQGKKETTPQGVRCPQNSLYIR